MPTGRLRLDDLEAIADAAAQGMGLAWLPYWLVRERLDTGALVGLFGGQPEFLYDCHALWPRSPRTAAKGPRRRGHPRRRPAEADDVMAGPKAALTPRPPSGPPRRR